MQKDKLDEANKQIELKLEEVDELAHNNLPLKEKISKQKQEMESMQIAVTKTQKMNKNIEKDLKEALQGQRSLSVKVETLTLEK